MSRTLRTVDWGPFVTVLPGVGLLVAGGYQFFEARSFLSSSAPTTAVITAMKDTSTNEGYHLCCATIEVQVGGMVERADLRLGGYWPETGESCAKISKLPVRYSLTDPADVRPAAGSGSNAQPFLIMGLLFSVPFLFMCGLALVGWWSSRARPVI